LKSNKVTRWKNEPTLKEVVLLVVIGVGFFGATLSALRGWHAVQLVFGDNAAYLEVAAAIRKWDFHGLDIQHFMGYPYAIAALSLVSRISLDASLWLVAAVASVVSTVLVARLWGTRVAGYFALTNFAWLQVSFLGGSEPLAVALGMGAFWNFRRGRVSIAVLLASLATTVRPLMFLILAGIGIALLVRKRYAAFLLAVGLGSVIGLLYLWPLWYFFGDPLLTVHSYTTRDYGAAKLAGPHGHLFGWPFHGIIVGTILYPGPITNLILSFFWIALVLAGSAAMFRKHLRNYWSDNVAEAVFCALYLLSIFCYDYLAWARGNFMRFAIPILPFVFFALSRWFPKDRRVLWCLSAISPILAACSAVGIRNLPFSH
jgi:hypothetical protein